MGEETARQLGIFGGHAHAAATARGIGGADIVQIGHGRNINPILRHRHHDIGKAEAHGADQMHAGFQLGRFFAQQVFAGDAQMDIARQHRSRDLAGRQQHDVNAGQAGKAGAIAARPCGLFDHQAGFGKPGIASLFEPPLGGNGDDKRHHAPPRNFLATSMRSVRKAQPMALTGLLAPRISISAS